MSARGDVSVPGSVRNKPYAMSQKAARVDQVFWPLSRQPPSTRRAVLLSDAKSLPAFGSDQACPQATSPRAIGRRMRSFCSSVPNSNRVGARRKMPVLGYATRRTEPIVLLFEDQPLEERGLTPAILLWARRPPPNPHRRACAPTADAARSLPWCRPKEATREARWLRAMLGTPVEKAFSESVKSRSIAFAHAPNRSRVASASAMMRWRSSATVGISSMTPGDLTRRQKCPPRPCRPPSTPWSAWARWRPSRAAPK